MICPKHGTRCRWLPWAILFFLTAAVGCRPRNHAAPEAGYYTGNLPDGRAVWFRWEPSGMGVSGELRSLATVEPQAIGGTNLTGGFRGRLADGSGNEAQVHGQFLLRTSSDGNHLVGLWGLPGSAGAQAVQFVKFAAWEERKRRTSLRFRQYGISREATVAWPRFTAPGPFWSAVNGWLEREAESRKKPFLRWSLDELKGIWDWPERGCSGEYYRECHWDVVWRTNDLVSLLESHDTYLGGIHGLNGYRSANLQWTGSGLRELRLSDFFRPESGWLDCLKVLVVKDLERQRADWFTARSTDGIADRTFTFNEQGMQFYYDPCEVGSYAAGAFTVHLPWERLAPFLPANGLVRLRSTGVVPVLPRENP